MTGRTLSALLLYGVIVLGSLWYVYDPYLQFFLVPDVSVSRTEAGAPMVIPISILDEENRPASILHFGDAMFGRSVGDWMARGNNPLSKLSKDIMHDADAMVLNLEGPITERTDCVKKAYSFRFDPSIVALLKESGFTAVSIANNHTYDCWREGIEDTKRFLEQGDVGWFGALPPEESVLSSEIAGQKVAFVGISTFSVPSAEPYYAVIESAKNNHDYVVVHIHWGEEYKTSSTKIQRTVAHRLIESGADVVIGHHPHVIEPVEIYKGKAIFYSLGNFVFDQNLPGTDRGIGVMTVLNDNGYEFVIHPFKITNYQPEFLLDVEAKMFCEEFLKDISNRDGCSFQL